MKRYFVNLSIFVALLTCLATFGATTNVNAQLLNQNFSSSTTVTDYVSATPNNGQFNSISTSGAGTAVTINNGTLQFARTANAGTFSRTTDFSPTPTSLIYKVDIAVSGNSTATTSAAVFQVGSAFTTANSAEANASTYARFAVNLTATNGTFQIRDITNGVNSANFSGNQTITWVLNNSGATLTYTAPDGSQQTVANDTADLYVGTTTAFNDVAVQTPTQTLTDLKFSFTAGTGTINLDNFLIDPVTAVAAVAGVTVTQSGGTTNVTEGGATDSYTVVLNTAPTADVTINITPNAQITTAPTSLTFTSANFATPQTVTVTAVDDTVVEGAHTGTITQSATSADTAYNGISVASVTANITDNDVAQTAPAITSANNATFTAGTAGTFTATATGNPAPTFTLTGTIPTGVSITSAGVLTSTTATPAGTYNFNIVATNGVAPDATQAFTLTVANTVSFTTGNIVVYRVGDGSTAPTNVATAVFLDEYTPAGTLVRSIALPSTATTSGNRALTASGSATSEGLLSVSTNSQFLLLTGYNATVGTAAVAGTTSTVVPRVIGRVSQTGVVDTTTTTTSFSGNNIRGAASQDGTNLYATGGTTGVVLTTLGSTDAGTIISNTQTSLRNINIFNNQLYVSSSSGTTRVATVGTGVPTTTGQTTTNLNLDVVPIAPFGIFITDTGVNAAANDTLYVADGALLRKYFFNGTQYVQSNTSTIATGSTGLAGRRSGTDVQLFITNPNGIQSITDTNAATVLPATATTIATATTNTAIRGIAFAPGTSNVTTAAGVSTSGKVLTAKGRGISRARVEVTDTTTGDVRSTFTSVNGGFKFEGLAAGRFYIVTVNAKRYSFDDNQQGLQLFEDNNGLIFKANR